MAFSDPPPAAHITLDFEGRPIAAVPGEPVAVALLRAGERVLSRSAKYHRPRGIQCMREHCASCLLRIDGLPNQLGCTTPCRDGMKVLRQNAFPDASHDVLRAIDWSFPKTFNHHEMFAGVPLASQVMAKVARQLAGLGELPDGPGASFAPAEVADVEAVLVGLGRSGKTQLEQRGPLAALDPRRGASVLGLYLEAGRPVLAVRRDQRLVYLRCERVVLCTGSRVQIPAFPGNDLPGVMTDVAAVLLLLHGVAPGQRVLVVGDPARRKATAAALRQREIAVTEAADGAQIASAEGGHQVRAVTLELPGGLRERWKGDAVAIAGARAPAYELAAQAGADLAFVPGRGFAVKTDASGRTSVPWLTAFGSCAEVSG